MLYLAINYWVLDHDVERWPSVYILNHAKFDIKSNIYDRCSIFVILKACIGQFPLTSVQCI